MSSRIIIENIASEEQLRASASADDLAAVSHFGAASRRCEVLAWRSVVRREVGECRIGYDDCGGPTVTDALGNQLLYIGVSHCRDRVAVILSERPCAIDIETVGRNFVGVACRFLMPAEMLLISEDGLLGPMWCAKEALYKFCRDRSLNLKDDIQIVECRADGYFVARVRGGESIAGRWWVEDEYIIAIVEG